MLERHKMKEEWKKKERKERTKVEQTMRCKMANRGNGTLNDEKLIKKKAGFSERDDKPSSSTHDGC